jgi:hypothetical protein
MQLSAAAKVIMPNADATDHQRSQTRPTTTTTK